jgi:hypothetical protein
MKINTQINTLICNEIENMFKLWELNTNIKPIEKQCLSWSSTNRRCDLLLLCSCIRLTFLDNVFSQKM